MAISDPDDLLASFRIAATVGEVPGWPVDIEVDPRPAPHERPRLPAGYGAVYLFAIGAELGARAPAGAGTVLKDGQVGPNSAARFEHQHYGVGAGSTLARSLLRYRVLWSWLGIEGLSEATVRTWMTLYLDRLHFLVPAGHRDVLASLEVYTRARVGSVFEGAA